MAAADAWGNEAVKGAMIGWAFRPHSPEVLDRRAEKEHEYESLGIESPSEWSPSVVRAFARDLQQRFGLSYLFISHDLKVVRALAHHLVVMKDGFVVEQGPAATVFDNPSTDYTRELMRAAFV